MIYGVFTFALSFAHLLRQIIIRFRLQKFEGYILKLHLHCIYTKSGCKRCIYVKCLSAFFYNLVMSHVVYGSKIMKPVRQLYYQYSYVLGHCQKHLSEILSLSFFLVFKFQRSQLRDSVHKKTDFLSEIIYQILLRIFGIFDNIVEKSRYNGFFIHAKISQYLSYGHRMYKIWFS